MSLVVTKNKLVSLLSCSLLIIIMLLILPSGFRGDVGPDSATYRSIYDAIPLESGLFYLSIEYSFEPLSSSLLWVLKYLKFSYEAVQLIFMSFAMIAVAYVYRISSKLNFLIFALLFIAFLYLQLQWSVIRHSLAFWSFSILVMRYKDTWAGFIASMFHYSFLLTIFRYKFKYSPFLLFLVFPVVVYYINKYSVLDNEFLWRFFWGGVDRFVYHIVVLLAILFTLRLSDYRYHFRHNKNHYVLVMVFLSAGMMFPLGWRLIALVLPILLIMDLNNVGVRKLLIFIVAMIFVIVQKFIYFTIDESLNYGNTSLGFIFEFYTAVAEYLGGLL